MRKIFWRIFSRIIECDNSHGAVYRGQQGNLKVIVQLINSFFLGPKGLIETNFSKNSCFHGGEKFWLFFPRFVECDKPQGRIYEGPQVIETITVEVIRSILWDLRGCLKHEIFEKKGKFSSEEESLTCFFWYCRTRTTKNVKERFTRVHKVFWQILWKL